MYTKMLVIFIVCMAFATNSWAILPADQQAAVDSISGNIGDLITAGWAILITMATAVIGMKVFKHLFGKATS